MNNQAVSVRNLTRRFGSFTAVDGITFEVERGTIFGFLGPNGAGKSTTIRMLCGLLRPSAGEGRVAGYDIMKESEKIKTKIGYMSQKFSLYQTLTVEENLDFYAGVYLMDRSFQAQKKQQVFASTELGHLREQMVSDLPSGARQLLALFCAIQHQPEIVFLDEPTAGVDPQIRRYFWEQIRDLSDHGTTVFVTTHHLDEAEECDRIAMLFNGHLEAMGDPDELKRTRFGGRIYRLLTENPWEAAKKIQNVAGVKNVAIFGTELHLTTDAATSTDTLRSGIAAVGFTDSLPAPIDPSLEDLFVSLIGEENR